ncbi:MAG TPA: aldo/keto reductase, partial [Rubrobacter sp.]|nr:aldo/keto reductase [Rubrobacter sp.]
MEYQTIKDEKVPSLGLGTYRLTGETCVRAVERALSMGYRHVDTAQMYDNESEVGRGIQEAGIDRAEIFLTTKVWPSDFAHDRVIRKSKESLKKLRTGYV